MLENKVFEKGDFIVSRFTSSIVIFEGERVMSNFTSTEKFTLLLYYNPEKYMEGKNGWGKYEVMDVLDKDHEVDFNLYDNFENTSYRLATEEEKQEFIDTILLKYDLLWDDDEKCLLDAKTMERLGRKEIVYEYNNEPVNISGDKTDIQLKFCLAKKKKTQTQPAYQGRCLGYGDYDDFYNDD